MNSIYLIKHILLIITTQWKWGHSLHTQPTPVVLSPTPLLGRPALLVLHKLLWKLVSMIVFIYPIAICVPLLYVVPMDPPISITVSVVNSTAIEVEWSPPETPNGIIIYYTIYINAIPTLNISAMVGNQSAVMEGLSPYQQVNVSISASNSAGEGPVSSQETVTTLETGEL